MIVKYPNPILSTSCAPFNFELPPCDPVELSTTLLQVMYDNKGIGLAANQIGIPYRVFVMRGHPESFACFNPRIVSSSGEETMEEACLSVPGVHVKVKRASHIRTRFQAPSGEVLTMDFDGLTARTFQHELDHLDGLMFFNKANRIHRDKAMKGYYNVKL